MLKIYVELCHKFNHISTYPILLKLFSWQVTIVLDEWGLKSCLRLSCGCLQNVHHKCRHAQLHITVNLSVNPCAQSNLDLTNQKLPHLKCPNNILSTQPLHAWANYVTWYLRAIHIKVYFTTFSHYYMKPMWYLRAIQVKVYFTPFFTLIQRETTIVCLLGCSLQKLYTGHVCLVANNPKRR